MIVVNGEVESDPASIEALKSTLAAMEQASRAEAGCEDYTFSVELNDPNRVRITERWVDQAALTEHFATPHMADFQKAIGENPPKKLTVRFYEATEIELSRG